MLGALLARPLEEGEQVSSPYAFLAAFKGDVMSKCWLSAPGSAILWASASERRRTEKHLEQGPARAGGEQGMSKKVKKMRPEAAPLGVGELRLNLAPPQEEVEEFAA